MEIRQLLQRADTAANWLLVNPVLAIAEIGVEADTGRYKIGNGVSSWTALGYARFDLAITRNATTVTVVATGDSAPLPAATPSLAGVMSAADKTKLDSLSTTQGDVLAAGNTVFTGINAFLNNSGVTIGRGQSANDGVVILGRAGGTASRRVSLVPAVLSANRTLTLPNESGTLVSTGSVNAVTGVMIAPLTITDANIASNAGIGDGKLAAITAAGKVANSATTATASNTANAIVSRDGSGNFSAGLITAALSGNATTATRLQTARQINGVSFDGSDGITITATTPSGLTLSSSGNGAAAGSSFDGSTARVISYNSVGAPSITGVNASGTWGISISGNAATASAATALQTARAINGVSFNGTSDITITADTGSALTFNSGGAGAVSGTTFNGSAAHTISYNTIGAPSTAGVGASGTWGIGITGNAATATRLATARTINGVSFDGSGNITLTANTGAALTFNNAGGGAASGSTFNGSAAQTISYNTIGAASVTGDNASGTWGIGISGNAATATRLATPRTINGVLFDGSGNITLTANTSAALTFSNAGTGAASGTTFNGATARIISYNSVGAPSTTGSGASGTWGINITGNAATVTNGVYTNANQAIWGEFLFSAAIRFGTTSYVPGFLNTSTGVAVETGLGTVHASRSNGPALSANSNVDGAVVSIRRAGEGIGSISVTAAQVFFNSTSDYRAKRNIALLSGAIARLKQLPVHRFEYISEPGKVYDGFLAHEAALAVPESVTGSKDAVDENDNPIYQQMDTSKLVPLVTAALQEAIARIELLEASAH